MTNGRRRQVTAFIHQLQATYERIAQHCARRLGDRVNDSVIVHPNAAISPYSRSSDLRSPRVHRGRIWSK
eukprot:1446050-Alexandrium_andersonii.AAC.1